MERIGVRYDLLPCEKTILQLHFWDRAFESLRDSGAIRLSESGRNSGCWVMDTDLAQDGEKVVVRSNATVTYVGKDIAYQMWQLGLLDRDFRWRRFYEYPDGGHAWISTAEAEEPDTPSFGSAALVHHVIDARQSYTQQVVQQAVARLTSETDRSRTRHLSYEMVALTPGTVEALGLGSAAGDGAWRFRAGRASASRPMISSTHWWSARSKKSRPAIRDSRRKSSGRWRSRSQSGRCAT